MGAIWLVLHLSRLPRLLQSKTSVITSLCSISNNLNLLIACPMWSEFGEEIWQEEPMGNARFVVWNHRFCRFCCGWQKKIQGKFGVPRRLFDFDGYSVSSGDNCSITMLMRESSSRFSEQKHKYFLEQSGCHQIAPRGSAQGKSENALANRAAGTWAVLRNIEVCCKSVHLMLDATGRAHWGIDSHRMSKLVLQEPSSQLAPDLLMESWNLKQMVKASQSNRRCLAISSCSPHLLYVNVQPQIFPSWGMHFSQRPWPVIISSTLFQISPFY